MFETAVDDPGRNAIGRLAGLFRVSAIGLLVGGIVFIFGEGRDKPLVAGILMAFSLLCAAGAWFTASGIESRKPWSRYTGLAIAILSLFSLGIGTLFGIVELYSLWRAERSGLFKPTAAAASHGVAAGSPPPHSLGPLAALARVGAEPALVGRASAMKRPLPVIVAQVVIVILILSALSLARTTPMRFIAFGAAALLAFSFVALWRRYPGAHVLGGCAVLLFVVLSSFSLHSRTLWSAFLRGATSTNLPAPYLNYSNRGEMSAAVTLEICTKAALLAVAGVLIFSRRIRSFFVAPKVGPV